MQVFTTGIVYFICLLHYLCYRYITSLYWRCQKTQRKQLGLLCRYTWHAWMVWFRRSVHNGVVNARAYY